ncbi:unnamed protein product [Closterium sp. Yama58-4]|nr:unnamed protein product [Closterium sp. Yama58-4]
MAALEGKLALLESQRQLSAVKCRIFVDMMESTIQCAEESTIEKYATYAQRDARLSLDLPEYAPYAERNTGLARTLSSSGAKQHAACERMRATNSNSSSGGGGGGDSGSSGDGRRAYEPAAASLGGSYRRRSIDVPPVSSAAARCASWREDMIFYAPSGSRTGSPARPLSRRRSGTFRAPAPSRGAPDAASAEALTRDVYQYDLPRDGETRRSAAAARRSFQTTRGYEDRCAVDSSGLSGPHWPASHRSQPDLRSQASLRSQRLSQRDLVSASDECNWLAEPSLPSRAATEPASNNCARSTSSSSFIVPSAFSSSNSIATTAPLFDSSLETGSSRSSSPASASSASPSSPEASARLCSPWTKGPFEQLTPVSVAAAPGNPLFPAAGAGSGPSAPHSAHEPIPSAPSDKEGTTKSRGGSWRRRAQPKVEERAEKAVEAQEKVAAKVAPAAQEGKPSTQRDRRRMSVGGFASSLLGDLRYK